MTAAAAFALLTGFVLAAILQFGFGVDRRGFVRVGLGLSLGIGAISLLLLGLESLFGTVGYARRGGGASCCSATRCRA